MIGFPGLLSTSRTGAIAFMFHASTALSSLAMVARQPAKYANSVAELRSGLTPGSARGEKIVKPFRKDGETRTTFLI